MIATRSPRMSASAEGVAGGVRTSAEGDAGRCVRARMGRAHAPSIEWVVKMMTRPAFARSMTFHTSRLVIRVVRKWNCRKFPEISDPSNSFPWKILSLPSHRVHSSGGFIEKHHLGVSEEGDGQRLRRGVACQGRNVTRLLLTATPTHQATPHAARVRSRQNISSVGQEDV